MRCRLFSAIFEHSSHYGWDHSSRLGHFGPFLVILNHRWSHFEPSRSTLWMNMPKSAQKWPQIARKWLILPTLVQKKNMILMCPTCLSRKALGLGFWHIFACKSPDNAFPACFVGWKMLHPVCVTSRQMERHRQRGPAESYPGSDTFQGRDRDWFLKFWGKSGWKCYVSCNSRWLHFTNLPPKVGLWP